MPVVHFGDFLFWQWHQVETHFGLQGRHDGRVHLQSIVRAPGHSRLSWWEGTPASPPSRSFGILFRGGYGWRASVHSAHGCPAKASGQLLYRDVLKLPSLPDLGHKVQEPGSSWCSKITPGSLAFSWRRFSHCQDRSLERDRPQQRKKNSVMSSLSKGCLRTRKWEIELQLKHWKNLREMKMNCYRLRDPMELRCFHSTPPLVRANAISHKLSERTTGNLIVLVTQRHGIVIGKVTSCCLPFSTSFRGA